MVVEEEDDVVVMVWEVMMVLPLPPDRGRPMLVSLACKQNKHHYTLNAQQLVKVNSS